MKKERLSWFVFVLVVALVFAVFIPLVMFTSGTSRMMFACFDVENETNFRGFSPADVRIEWNPEATVRQTQSVRLMQIGRKMNQTSILVVVWNATQPDAVVDSVEVFGFRGIDCPENTISVMEPIR